MEIIRRLSSAQQPPAAPPPPDEPREIDLSNRYLVTARKNELFVMHPRPGAAMTRDDALNLAVWLIVIAGIEDDELLEARRVVENA
jgi:hypothetical protein